MKKQEKLEHYVQEFIKLGKGKEEALIEAEKLIPYGQEDYLTLQQLKIKFNYPDMDGEYPEWLTADEHYKICRDVAKSQYDYSKFGWFCNKNELISKLYIWSRIRLNKFNSINHLKVGLFNACKNILRDEITKETKKRSSTDRRRYVL